MDLSSRILHLIEKEGITKYELAKGANLSEATIGRILKGETRKLSDKNLEKFSNYFHVSKSYLRTGKKEVQKIYQNQNSVPYYDIDITATITGSFSDVKEKPEFYIDFKPFNDCTAYLPLYGDSMFPTYASGEIIAVKKINNPDVILWGEAYLIITDESANNMRTVKLLFPHPDDDKVILRASNPNYKGDTVIDKKSILSLYVVKGKITRKQL